MVDGLLYPQQRRVEREAEEQQRRRRLEEERLLADLERKRETIRYRRLIGDCEDWRSAADIRAFVGTVEVSPMTSSAKDAFATWKRWALGHADRIDPLRDDDLFDQKVEDYEVYSLRE
jgi:hypothetical protein